MDEKVLEQTGATFELKPLELVSGFDRLKLSALVMEPKKDETPKGVVVLVHGMAEHKERYIPFMKFLAEHGYISIIHDHRGHGASIKEEGDLGYLYQRGDEGIVNDVVQVVQYAKARYRLPVHLFGHSMGSLIVRIYLQNHDTDIESLTISGCVGPNSAAGAGVAIASLIGKFKGERYRSPFMNNMAFGSYNKACPDAKSPFAWLSVNEDNVKAYEEDPLCGYNFTINGYKALLNMVKKCYTSGLYHGRHADLPIFFISGEDDPCRAGERGWKDAVDFMKNLGYTRVTARLMSGMRHEILNEKDNGQVLDLILENIEEGNHKDA